MTNLEFESKGSNPYKLLIKLIKILNYNLL